MEEKILSFSIQGWDTNNGEKCSIHEELKKYAQSTGWTEYIPNPNYVEGGEEPETILNPKDYNTYVFYDKTMEMFFYWLKNNKINCSCSDIENEINSLKSQVSLIPTE